MDLKLEVNELLQKKLSRRDLIRATAVTSISLSTLWALACQQAAPTTTPQPGTPAGPTEEKIGKHLIGKLEGPQTITDSAKFPKQFKEAPALEQLAKAGKLPPVKERIGEDPLVLKPLREIGKYGGIIRRGFTGPADDSCGIRFCGNDSMVHWDTDGATLIPLLAKA